MPDPMTPAERNAATDDLRRLARVHALSFDPCGCSAHADTHRADCPTRVAWVQIDAEAHWREPRTPGVTFCGEVINKSAVPVEGTPDDQDICERCWNLGCPRG